MVDVQVWEEDTSVDRAYTALGGETEPGATSGAARTVNASQGRRAEPCLDDHRSSSSPSDHAYPKHAKSGRPPTHQHHKNPRSTGHHTTHTVVTADAHPPVTPACRSTRGRVGPASNTNLVIVW